MLAAETCWADRHPLTRLSVGIAMRKGPAGPGLGETLLTAVAQVMISRKVVCDVMIITIIMIERMNAASRYRSADHFLLPHRLRPAGDVPQSACAQIRTTLKRRRTIGSSATGHARCPNVLLKAGSTGSSSLVLIYLSAMM